MSYMLGYWGLVRETEVYTIVCLQMNYVSVEHTL